MKSYLQTIALILIILMGVRAVFGIIEIMTSFTNFMVCISSQETDKSECMISFIMTVPPIGDIIALEKACNKSALLCLINLLIMRME